jgi:O-succinylbenzoate synthase
MTAQVPSKIFLVFTTSLAAAVIQKTVFGSVNKCANLVHQAMNAHKMHRAIQAIFAILLPPQTRERANNVPTTYLHASTQSLLHHSLVKMNVTIANLLAQISFLV